MAPQGALAQAMVLFLFGGSLFSSTPNPHHILHSLLGAGVTLEIGENMAGGTDSVFWVFFLLLLLVFYLLRFFSCLLLFVVFNRELVSWAIEIARSQNCLADRLLLLF